MNTTFNTCGTSHDILDHKIHEITEKSSIVDCLVLSAE